MVYKEKYGLDNVFYLPLAVNTTRLQKTEYDACYSSDISLVGGLYSSDSYLGLKSIMSEEQQRYAEAVVGVQLNKTGSSVVDASLTDEFISEVCSYYRHLSPKAIQPTKEQLFYSICWNKAALRYVML